MTSSAPFPGEPTYEELANPKHGFFVEVEGQIRGLVPSFYQKHPDDSVIVTSGGEPLMSCGASFTVAQVPIERRWAIKHDGEVLGELEFRNLHIQWYQEFFKELQRRDPESKGKIDGGRPDYDIPDPLRYVSVQVDQINPRRFVRANYQPHATEGAHSKEFFTTEGERVEEARLKVLCNAFADPNLRKKLKPHELDEVANALGLNPVEAAGDNGIASQLELLNSMLADGDLTTEQHSKRVALLTGAPTPAPAAPGGAAQEPDADGETAEGVGGAEENPGEPPTYTAQARCGVEFTKKSNNGALGAVRFHEQKCPACAEMGD